MTITVTSNHGRTRPAQPWKRYDVRALRIARLARDVEAEADRHPDDSPIRASLERIVAELDAAAQAVADPA